MTEDAIGGFGVKETGITKRRMDRSIVTNIPIGDKGENYLKNENCGGRRNSVK